MIGFNHALVGGLISTLAPWPIAIPLSLASHFLLDMLPHYGIPHHHRDDSRFWKWFFTVDFFATLSLAIWAICTHRYAMFFCGLAAVLPDFVWVARVIQNKSFTLSHRKTRYESWHIGIQHHEYQWGIWLELPLAMVLFYFVVLQAS